MFFLLVEEDEEGETYEPVEDEALQATLFARFMEMMEEDERDE